MEPTSKAPFFLGVNYPWLTYGKDFGRVGTEHAGISVPKMRELVEQDFARIRETGVTVVRWFLFGDGRGGFVCEKGIPHRPDEFLFADVRESLELADRFGLKLCFSLLDYLWLQEHAGKRTPHPHEHVLHFAAGREAFLLNVLIPLFREFREHSALYAWEIANEPEWAIREFTRDPAAKLHYAEFRAYAEEMARAVHEFANVPVTLGSARPIWIRAWSKLPLDFYQVHYYPSTERENRTSLMQELAAISNLKKPLWLGELPARDNPGSGYSLSRSLDLCRDAGLCGAAVWRWTTPEAQGTDISTGQLDPAELKAWSTRPRYESHTA
jgi:hypothetical protein